MLFFCREMATQASHFLSGIVPSICRQFVVIEVCLGIEREIKSTAFVHETIAQDCRLQNRIVPSLPVAANVAESGVNRMVFAPVGRNSGAEVESPVRPLQHEGL